MNPELGDIIAVRVFDNAETSDRITVKIGRPRPFEDGSGWYCPYVIQCVHPRVSYAGGIDAVQALQLAMVKIGMDLTGVNEDIGGVIRWCGDRDLGFPHG